MVIGGNNRRRRTYFVVFANVRPNVAAAFSPINGSNPRAQVDTVLLNIVAAGSDRLEYTRMRYILLFFWKRRGSVVNVSTSRREQSSKADTLVGVETVLE